MRLITYLLLGALTLACFCTAEAGAIETTEKLLLAEEGISDFRIAISESASISEHHAAEELQTFLEQICGVRLPIITDEEPVGKNEIILGDSKHLKEVPVDIDLSDLGNEGFVIRTVPPHLIIAGGSQRGTLYGVYAFLEDHLGCRWFTSSVSHIPKIPRLEIEAINERQQPALEYREVHFFDALDANWSARNRLNSSMGRLTEKQGGKVTYYPFVHTFFTLIPPEEFFETNPEWFSLVDGERTLVGRYKRTQLCLTNEEMIQQAIKTVREWIRDNQEANIISISQNDGPGGWCECENCVALEEKEGGAHSAPIIYFVNRIAEVIGKEHPDIAIDTLAYSYSRKAPQTLKPLPNVIIRLTSGGCCSHPIADEQCDRNVGLRDDIRDWFRLTNRMYVWDYVVNFHQYLLPFPNLHTLQPNIQFLVDHGVRGIFEQGSADNPYSDMAPLKAYLLAKLLWDPDYDRKKATEEFLAAYYGPAGKSIGEYLERLESDTRAGRYLFFHMTPFERSSVPNYLTPELLAEATKLFDEAERTVANDAEKLERVKVARLSLDYVKLQLAARLNGLVRLNEKSIPFENWYLRMIDDFFSTAKESQIDYMREAGRPDSTMEEFREILEEFANPRQGHDNNID